MVLVGIVFDTAVDLVHVGTVSSGDKWDVHGCSDYLLFVSGDWNGGWDDECVAVWKDEMNS